MGYYGIFTTPALAHHGVRGQKWGVRRYQNANGSLTSEGKLRLGRTNRTAKSYGRAAIKSNKMNRSVIVNGPTETRLNSLNTWRQGSRELGRGLNKSEKAIGIAKGYRRIKRRQIAGTAALSGLAAAGVLLGPVGVAAITVPAGGFAAVTGYYARKNSRKQKINQGYAFKNLKSHSTDLDEDVKDLENKSNRDLNAFYKKYISDNK